MAYSLSHLFAPQTIFSPDLIYNRLKNRTQSSARAQSPSFSPSPTFPLGIWKFNALHIKYDEVAVNYYYLLTILLYIDWNHILVSLQIVAPTLIWRFTVPGQVVHLGLSTCFPEHFRRHMEERKALAEEEGQGATETKRERA
jgi:hypothetical protein